MNQGPILRLFAAKVFQKRSVHWTTPTIKSTSIPTPSAAATHRDVSQCNTVTRSGRDQRPDRTASACTSGTAKSCLPIHSFSDKTHGIEPQSIARPPLVASGTANPGRCDACGCSCPTCHTPVSFDHMADNRTLLPRRSDSAPACNHCSFQRRSQNDHIRAR